MRKYLTAVLFDILRGLVKHSSRFHMYKTSVEWHISSKYDQKMSIKSVVVSNH